MKNKFKVELLSVIVPAYNCKTINRDLKKLDKYLSELNYPYEIICVVDGKKTNKDNTKEKAKKVSGKNIKIFSYKKNKGKGFAIRYGMKRSKGNIISFIDAGSDLNVSGIGMAIEHMKWYDADIIIGSKRHHASKINYPWQRKILSFVVQRVTKIFFNLNVSDTQTGLKIFKREVIEDVLPRLLIKRWAFDLEILAVSKRLGYEKIYESPVEIEYNFASNIGFKAVYSFAYEYLQILYRMYFLKYYDHIQYKDKK